MKSPYKMTLDELATELQEFAPAPQPLLPSVYISGQVLSNLFFNYPKPTAADGTNDYVFMYAMIFIKVHDLEGLVDPHDLVCDFLARL